MAEMDVRKYSVQAWSTETFGRVLSNSRNHHLVVDGPVENGCPGEAITPSELFLCSIASCGVELVQVLARGQNLPLEAVSVSIWGMRDRSKPVRPDVSLFNTIRLHFHLKGVTEERATHLIEGFKSR